LAEAVAVNAGRGEARLAALWGSGARGALRLEDGRALRVVFPGVPGGGAGPDFRGAILDAGGDLLRGDVEVHLRASGWRAHGHHRDPAYAGVVLHVVGENDAGAAATLHACGRAIAVLVLRQPGGERAWPPPFTPPCALATATGADPGPALERLGLRRLRMKAARAAPLVEAAGPGQALYAQILETLAGPANRPAFAALSRRLPLAALMERSESKGSRTNEHERNEAGAGGGILAPVSPRPEPPRALRVAAELRGAAAALTLRRAGLRPMASPGRRLDLAGALICRLWREGAEPGWPDVLAPEGDFRALKVASMGAGLLVELWVNAILPVAMASGGWTEEAAVAAWKALPSPGTYGKLRPLEGWLGGRSARPFRSAARLQGGLLLHAESCTRGMCGRCPMEATSNGQ
jgi:hypothetical protein